MLRTTSTALRSIQPQRRLRVESLENRCLLSHPTVTAVDVAGTNWAPSFVAYLQSSGLGVGGYAIPVGSSAQLQTLPWANLDTIRITFSEDVVVAAADLSVSGVNQTAYAFSDFSYDPSTFTATWTLAAPLAKDKLMLDLDANGMAPVHSVSTGDVLDGAWTDCQSVYPSGNGQGGADFKFSFNVLPGDATMDGIVNGADLNAVLSGYNKTGLPWAHGDFYGNGTVNGADLNVVLSNYNESLPSGNPAAMTCEAPTTSGIPDLSVAAGTVDQVLALTDFFADSQTPPAAMVYSIVQNSNASLFSSLAIDSSGNLTLTFANNTTGDATLTVRATDAAGLLVDTTLAVHVCDPPVIGNFFCINDFDDMWTLTGTVTDNDEPVLGDVVTFGGVLASYNLSTTVGTDGVFSLTVELAGLQDGTGTAQTADPYGVLSNVAQDYVIV